MTGVLAYILGVLIFLFGIGLSIGLHEVGHMWPAKAFGARVSKYMIGFGPTVFSRKIGETEYGFKLLPLGGYVAISGMYPPERAGAKQRGPKWLRELIHAARAGQNESDGEYDHSRAFYRLSVPKRIVVMLGGPFMNLFLGVVFISIAILGIPAWHTGTTVERVFACIETKADGSCPAGATTSPASQMGLQKGDQIVKVNGQSISSWLPVNQYLINHPSQTIHLQVLRGGKVLNLSGRPVPKREPAYNLYTGSPEQNADGSAKYHLRGMLGFQLNQVKRVGSVEYTAGYAGAMISATADMVLQLPNEMVRLVESTFGSAKRDSSGLVSIVGVGSFAGSVGQSTQMDAAGKIAAWLMILGSLNFALFVFNLIPLLPLDGGHVLNALADGARRGLYRLFGKADPGPLDTAKTMPFTMVMWFVLMGMGILSILADFIKPIAFG